MRTALLTSCWLIAVAVVFTPAAIVAAPAFDIPRVSQIAIDADDADWAKAGLHIDMLTGTSGALFDPKDLNARMRVGWDQEGLLLLVHVSDDVRDENAGDPVGRNDSVEVFVSAGQGSGNRYQYSVAAGPPQGKPRGVIDDRRSDKSSPPKLEVEMAAKGFDGGYVVEMRLPWANLGRGEVKPGDDCGLQVRVNDTDKGPRKSALWLLKTDSYNNADSVHRAVLAETATRRRIDSIATATYDTSLAGVNIAVTALPELAEADVEVRRGEAVIKRGRLERQSHHASATLRLPMLPRGEEYGALDLQVKGEPAGPIDIPSATDTRARRLVQMPVMFEPANVFGDSNFPRADFESRLAAEQAIGPYRVRTTFYDADYNVVKAAEKPGRYGAVVEFEPEDGGRMIRRFRTVYRTPKPLQIWASGVRSRLENPQALGLPEDAMASAGEQWELFSRDMLDRALHRDSSFPAVMAYLAEQPQPRWRRNTDAMAQDRQWWVGLKRKLNGWDKRWPEPFVAPRPIEGKPAPVLRDGSLADAGMTADGVRKIDELCAKWAADSDEGFSVCIARHGVIALHKAYGQRHGRAMTLDDKSRLASITKVFSGVAMMMLIDQGLISMNDPVEKYLPALSRQKAKRPATIRHLYTHTAGLWDHWGDEQHDLDEAVGEYYPRLQVGKRHEYNGTSLALGGKIVEAVTGEALPTFYLKHILEPLGMDDADVFWSGSGAESTARDLAVFGQMLLNGGAYGEKRYLHDQSLAAMMPRPLSDLLDGQSGIEWGFGIMHRDGSANPFGPRTFGHGAASNSIFAISPEKDLVLVMARNAAGANYGKYESSFLNAVAAAIDTSDGSAAGR